VEYQGRADLGEGNRLDVRTLDHAAALWKVSPVNFSGGRCFVRALFGREVKEFTISRCETCISCEAETTMARYDLSSLELTMIFSGSSSDKDRPEKVGLPLVQHHHITPI